MSLLGSLAPAFARAADVTWDVPAGACDCHVHVFGDPSRYPYWSGRTYTPPMATVDELLAMHRALHLERTVVVQPSVYGTDNRCTLDAVRRLGPAARAIVVIDEATSDAQLDAFEQAGARGIRLNLVQSGVSAPDAARRTVAWAVKRIAGRPWHVQINTRPAVIRAIREIVQDAPVPVVFDHFGGAAAEAGLEQPGFPDLVALVQSGRAYVKISGAADGLSLQAPTFADAAPFARTLVSANPDRILWGSNWPHPTARAHVSRPPDQVTPFARTDDAAVFNLLPVWVPDADLRRRILVENPARLYRLG